MRELADEPLAPRTTLEIGGAARRLLVAETEEEIVGLLAGVDGERPVVILGGGSNVVIADRGIEDTVLLVATRGVAASAVAAELIDVHAAAGEPWDELVAHCVAEGLTGVECLSGIPGSVGAAPLQNIGAYGQQVGDVVEQVRAFDRASGQVVVLPRQACGFGYRRSVFKVERRGRYVVLGVTLRLGRRRPAAPRYDELRRALAGADEPELTPQRIRAAVLQLRRAKSMVVDPADPHSRSVGSFFLNPVVSSGEAAQIEQRARRARLLEPDAELPRHPEGETPDRVKLPAAWLIERAGFGRGLRRGGVGISASHALAIVNYDEGTAAEVLALAGEIRAAVKSAFGVTLQTEPVLLGFTAAELAPLCDGD